jgi:hypothetical protein
MWLQVAGEWGKDVREARGTEAEQLNDSDRRNTHQQALKWIAQHRPNVTATSLAQMVSGN